MTASSIWASAGAAAPQSSATPRIAANASVRIVLASEAQPDAELRLAREVGGRRNEEVRRLTVAGRRHFVQAVADVEHVEEEVQAVQAPGQRQLVTNREIDRERFGTADAERDGPALGIELGHDGPHQVV